MKKNILRLAAMLLVVAGSFGACGENGENPKKTVCNVNNPLTDLPWLKEIINKRVQGETSGMYMNIFQCTYENSAVVGFYIEPCVNCHNYTAYLASCDGVVLDDFSGTLDMENFHKKWNIKNKKLIWTNIK